MCEYTIDIQGMLGEVSPAIHKSELTQDIKDSWVYWAVENNIEHLHEGNYESFG